MIEGEEDWTTTSLVLSVLPVSLNGFCALKHLDLSGNSSAGLQALEGALKGLKTLDSLFLSRCGLDTVPDVIRTLPRLRMLALRENKLTRVESGAFPDSLEWLILGGNALTHIGVLPTGMLKMGLSNNRLTRFPENLASLTRLELLRVSNNCLEESQHATPPQVLPTLKWYGCPDNPSTGSCSFSVAAMSLRMEAPLEPLAKLGEGSSGIVYRALHKGRNVAWKVYRQLLSSDGLVSNEINMAAAVGNISSPFLQKMAGWYQDESQLCVAWVMDNDNDEFVDLAKPPSWTSCTRDVYDDTITYPEALTIGILCDVIDAVGQLHCAGVCHGDVYGHNIRVKCVLIFSFPLHLF